MTPFPTSPVPIIAPLWADYDFREAGNVNYRVTEDETTLARVRGLIVKINPNFSEFSPLLSVIVTWSEATLFSRRRAEIISKVQVIFSST